MSLHHTLRASNQILATITDLHHHFGTPLREAVQQDADLIVLAEQMRHDPTLIGDEVFGARVWFEGADEDADTANDRDIKELVESLNKKLAAKAALMLRKEER